MRKEEGEVKKVTLCQGCGKEECEAPPLVANYQGDGCGVDQSGFEDNCAGQTTVKK